MSKHEITIRCTRSEGQRYADCWRFCAGYQLPDGVTLADVLAKLDELAEWMESEFAGDPDSGYNEMPNSARALLAAFGEEE